DGVGGLDLAARVQELGHSSRPGAGDRIGPADVRSLEEDVEVHVLDNRPGREETAASAEEVERVSAVGSVRLADAVLRGPEPKLHLGAEAEPGVRGEPALTRRTDLCTRREGCP